MERLKLSPKAKEVKSRLVSSRDSEKTGYIAAVDPQTGEAFYGKTVAEAAKKGRKIKKILRRSFSLLRSAIPLFMCSKRLDYRAILIRIIFLR